MDSQQEINTYFQLKTRHQLAVPLIGNIKWVRQLIYFQRLYDKFPHSFLKNILPFIVWKIRTNKLYHEEFIYIFADEDNIDYGFQVPTEFQTNVMKQYLFISKLAHQAFQSLLQKSHYWLDGLGLQEKFWMICEGRLIKASYNCLVFKKGEQADGIYIILHGQFKFVAEQAKETKYIEQGSILANNEINSLSGCWNCSLRSNQNQSRVLHIPLNVLEKYNHNKSLTSKIQGKDLKIKFKKQILRYSLEQPKSYTHQQFCLKDSIRKIREFMDQRGTHSTLKAIFEEKVQQKKLKDINKLQKKALSNYEKFNTNVLWSQIDKQRCLRVLKLKKTVLKQTKKSEIKHSARTKSQLNILFKSPRKKLYKFR